MYLRKNTMNGRGLFMMRERAPEYEYDRIGQESSFAILCYAGVIRSLDMLFFQPLQQTIAARRSPPRSPHGGKRHLGCDREVQRNKTKAASYASYHCIIGARLLMSGRACREGGQFEGGDIR